MQRAHSEHNSINHLVFPIIFNFDWHQCECCKLDFRFESGWRYLTGPYYGGKGVTKYICKRCKPTRNDVIDYLNKKEKTCPTL